MAGKKKASDKKKDSSEDEDEKLQNELEEKTTADVSDMKNTGGRDEEEKKTVSLDRFLRLQAEFDNYRKRVEKEKREMIEYSTEKIIKKMLDVLDNFERAFQSLENGGTLEEFRDGIEKVHKLFRDILENEGVSEITETEKFNPYLHDAMAQEINEDVDDETVTEVFQKGYRLGSKVIRPVKVKVSRKE